MPTRKGGDRFYFLGGGVEELWRYAVLLTHVLKECCSHHMIGYHKIYPSCLFYPWEGGILSANTFESLGNSYSLRGGF